MHHADQALKAHALFIRDRDYIVREGEVIAQRAPQAHRRFFRRLQPRPALCRDREQLRRVCEGVDRTQRLRGHPAGECGPRGTKYRGAADHRVPFFIHHARDRVDPARQQRTVAGLRAADAKTGATRGAAAHGKGDTAARPDDNGTRRRYPMTKTLAVAPRLAASLCANRATDQRR